ncbi:MAG: hypothetical protein HOH43_00670 [Candidatus Latescibacteria bacterium]|nr:hypothetical protein [Candidatus Latescibacterota bacterium]
MPRQQPEISLDSTVNAGLSTRAILVGLALAILVNVWVPYGSFLVHSSRMTMAHLPIAVLIPFFFLLLVVNPVLRISAPSRVLNAGELGLIFAMLFVASLAPGKVLAAYLFGVMATPYYYATTENQWEQTFFDYLPDWLLVHNDGNALVWFYEGLPPGVTDIPWEPWLVPLFWWIILFGVIFFMGACVATIMRKSWVDHERISFPLARLAVDLIRHEERVTGRFPVFVHDRLFQIGFCLSLGVMAWNILSFWGDLPPLPVGSAHGMSLTVMDGAQPVRFALNVYALCFAFLAPMEITFSLWFFSLFGTIEGGILNRFGLATFGSPVGADAVVKAQFFGGFIVFVLAGLWTARRHLKQVILDAIRNGGKADGAELMSYRAAVFGLLVGIAYLVTWLSASGLDWWMIPVFLGFLTILYVGMTRIVAQTGLVFLDLPVNAHHFSILFTGSGNISPTSLTTLGLASAYARNWRSAGLGTIAHVDKVVSDLNCTKRRLLGVLVLTFMISLVSTMVYTIYVGYTTTGAYNFGTRDAFGGINESYYDDIVRWIRNASQLQPAEFAFMLGGGVVMVVLTVLSHRFPGWPLAPVGFTVAFADISRLLMFSLFLAWLGKFLLIRIGGVTAYRRAQPLVWGILVGYCAGVFLGFIVDWIWFYGRGHALHDWI